jgi:hypothetical protein
VPNSLLWLLTQRQANSLREIFNALRVSLKYDGQDRSIDVRIRGSGRKSVMTRCTRALDQTVQQGYHLLLPRQPGHVA